MLIQSTLTTCDACGCFLFHSTLLPIKIKMLVATHFLSRVTNRLKLQKGVENGPSLSVHLANFEHLQSLSPKSPLFLGSPNEDGAIHSIMDIFFPPLVVLRGLWDLSSLIRGSNLHPEKCKSQVLTTGLPRNCPYELFLRTYCVPGGSCGSAGDKESRKTAGRTPALGRMTGTERAGRYFQIVISVRPPTLLHHCTCQTCSEDVTTRPVSSTLLSCFSSFPALPLSL